MAEVAGVLSGVLGAISSARAALAEISVLPRSVETLSSCLGLLETHLRNLSPSTPEMKEALVDLSQICQEIRDSCARIPGHVMGPIQRLRRAFGAREENARLDAIH